MQNTREDVRGMARAAVAHARSLCDDVEFSPMDATRSDVEFTAEVAADRDRRGRDHDQHPRHRRLHDAARVRRLPDAAVRARAGAARRRAVGPLPRRSGPGGRQLDRRRDGRRAPGRVRGQRHRRARRQRRARGDHHADRHAAGGARRAHRRGHQGDRADLADRLAPDRLSGAAEQGDHRPQRVRARVGHPPGRRAQGAQHLRDHGRDHRSVSTPTSWCWASTRGATRCSRR